ncbi:MAG TPA: superoxide dismutase family protein [Alphaproteobacteria bacterium]|nr:superoxide dismutase family protein [Alphaproteobacteria bacterium]
MKKKALWIVLVLLVIAFLAYLYKIGGAESYDVTMINNKGEEIGVIRLNETNAGVLLGINLRKLKPDGEHAIHIHEKADCTPLDSFTNAGGHFNPTHVEHGMKNPKGYHAGDMPNIKPDKKGNSVTQILNRKITLLEFDIDDRKSVFDRDGSAIVIHDGADDHMSQPAGAAGKRVACGVIKHK